MLVNVRNRIKTLSTLRESEMRQRALLSAIPDLVFRLDRDGIYLDYHASNPDDLVVPPEQFLGHKGIEFLPADVASAHQSKIEQVFLTNSEAIYEYSALIHGQMNDYEARMVRAGENEVLTIVRNVTERKRMEVALRQSEARMRSIMGNMRDSVWAIDLIGNRETYYNPVTESIYGRSVNDFYENPELWREMIHPDDREIMTNSHNLVIEHGFAEWEYRIIRPDGSVRWLHDRSWGVYNEQGVAIRLEGIASDVTERRQMQHREVELRLEKERRQLLTVFFQNAAHEFRTPLTIIGSSTYLMTRVDNEERRRHAAGQINLQIERITRLVDMLQLMTGLESTQVDLDTRVNIGEIVQTLSTQLGEIYSKTHETDCHVSYELPSITGNHNMLTIAFRQILENAYRFTPERGKITVQAGATDGQIWIEVVDTGVGIASEDLPMIFDTFWRRDIAHSTPGFGLGLSIARKVIEEHGGWIAVDSTEGKGSRFRVYLPIRMQNAMLIEPIFP
jgi:PAS domain S-box-containing protein